MVFRGSMGPMVLPGWGVGESTTNRPVSQRPAAACAARSLFPSSSHLGCPTSMTRRGTSFGWRGTQGSAGGGPSVRLEGDTRFDWQGTHGSAGGGHMVRLEVDPRFGWRGTHDSAEGGHRVRLEGDTGFGWQGTHGSSGGGPSWLPLTRAPGLRSCCLSQCVFLVRSPPPSTRDAAELSPDSSGSFSCCQPCLHSLVPVSQLPRARWLRFPFPCGCPPPSRPTPRPSPCQVPAQRPAPSSTKWPPDVSPFRTARAFPTGRIPRQEIPRS